MYTHVCVRKKKVFLRVYTNVYNMYTHVCVRKKGAVPTVPVSPSLLRAAVVPG